LANIGRVIPDSTCSRRGIPRFHFIAAPGCLWLLQTEFHECLCAASQLPVALVAPLLGMTTVNVYFQPLPNEAEHEIYPSQSHQGARCPPVSRGLHYYEHIRGFLTVRLRFAVRYVVGATTLHHKPLLKLPCCNCHFPVRQIIK